MPTRAVNITEHVYKVYKTDEYKTGGSELRLVAWVVDGKERPARLERRDYFIQEDGNRRNAKAKGLTYEDISLVMEKGAEIQNLMVGIKDEIRKNTQPDESDLPVEEGVPF